MIARLALLLLAACSPTPLPRPESARVEERSWAVRCEPERCVLQITVPFERGHGVEEAALAVSYDRRTKAAQYVSVYVPPDARREDGLVIRFLDLVQRGGAIEPERVSDPYALPIVECTKEHCVARVHPKLDNRDGTSLDLFDELQKRGHVWVLFTRRHEPEPVRIMIPVNRFRDEVRKLRERNGEGADQ